MMKKQCKVLSLMLIFGLFVLALVPFSVFAAGKGTGTLVITAQDTAKKQVAAQITVDNEPRGTGTVTLKKLPAKTYVVSFGDLTGYTIVSPRSGKKSVQVKAGKTMRVTATYKKSSSGGGSGGTKSTMKKLPDTGQTGDYTTVFGEDSDYTINPPSYTDNGNGAVTDNVTGLVWQKQDDAAARTWDAAVSYCDVLDLAGYSDWRLPSVMELSSMVNAGTYSPAVDAAYFPGTSSSNYWSSTTLAGDASYAWYVYFDYGHVGYGDESDNHYARCVRGGQ